MAYEMLTRTGRSFYEITSVMQHGIRKGDYELAGYCMWELWPQYAQYLRKRFLIISAEDCFGVITKEILHLCDIGDAESMSKALLLMCQSKKNRDADYFVCNLMCADGPVVESKETLARTLYTEIRKIDVVSAGKTADHLFHLSRKTFWKMLKEAAQAYYPHLVSEIEGLCEANERVSKPAEETIFVAKAIVLLWTAKEPKEALLSVDGMSFDKLLDPESIVLPKSVEECRKYRTDELFPDWSYNWHTIRGKYQLRRDAVHAITNDQRILTPLEENLFDDCTWNRDINACLQKWNPKNYRLPYNDGKRDPGEKFGG